MYLLLTSPEAAKWWATYGHDVLWIAGSFAYLPFLAWRISGYLARIKRNGRSVIKEYRPRD
jgi:hypothetical protein